MAARLWHRLMVTFVQENAPSVLMVRDYSLAGNVDPTLVYTCSDETADDDIFEELVTYLGQKEETPNAPAASPAEKPVKSPVSSPVQTTAETPATPSTTAQQPTEEEEEPATPINPSDTTNNTSSSAGMRNVMAVLSLALVVPAFLFTEYCVL
jgi:hypothetical protein